MKQAKTLEKAAKELEKSVAVMLRRWLRTSATN